LTAIFDDDDRWQDTEYAGVPVRVPCAAVREVDAMVVVAIGNPRAPGVRRVVVDRLDLEATRYATVIASDAFVGSGCEVGPGSVLMPHVVCTADVRIGAHTNVMPSCTMTHDVRVGSFVAVGSAVQLAGGVQVGDGAYLGAGALVREGVRVGSGALVGMGSVVLHDVPDGETWAGNPARRLR
jgi:sugar O-acyltransferase (sialic acid O-acetyltransferase NeuD family)